MKKLFVPGIITPIIPHTGESMITSTRILNPAYWAANTREIWSSL